MCWLGTRLRCGPRGRSWPGLGFRTRWWWSRPRLSLRTRVTGLGCRSGHSGLRRCLRPRGGYGRPPSLRRGKLRGWRSGSIGCLLSASFNFRPSEFRPSRSLRARLRRGVRTLRWSGDRFALVLSRHRRRRSLGYRRTSFQRNLAELARSVLRRLAALDGRPPGAFLRLDWSSFRGGACGSHRFSRRARRRCSIVRRERPIGGNGIGLRPTCHRKLCPIGGCLTGVLHLRGNRRRARIARHG